MNERLIKKIVCLALAAMNPGQQGMPNAILRARQWWAIYDEQEADGNQGEE